MDDGRHELCGWATMAGVEISPAAALIRIPGATISHELAARALGIELVDPLGLARLTVPRNHSRKALAGWQVCRADLSDADLVLLPDGLRVTAAIRSVRDLARVLALDAAVASADSALRLRLVSLGDLVAALTSTRGPGAPQLRAVAGLLDPLSGSVLESLLRVLLHCAGLPPPETQLQLYDERGRPLLRADFSWRAQRLVVEADGFAFHSDRVAYRRDRNQMNELERLGWRVLRFTWEDVRSRPDYVVALVRECLAHAAA